MMFRTFATALLFGSLSYAQLGDMSSISNVSSSDCPKQGGAHIIVARASTEQTGYGIIGAVKDEVLSRVPGSTAEYVNYPATLDNYFSSESDGVVAMRKLINNYISKCNASLPLVVMGYSQGAQVTADSLVGQEVAIFPDNTSISQPLPASTLSRIAAVVMMGDPTFTTNETFHVGNATKNGLFPREDVSRFNTAGLASRTKSYCDANDPYCASGDFQTGLSVHIGYVKEYGMQAENFIVNQIKAYYANETMTSNGTTMSNGTSSSGGSGAGASATSTMPATYAGSASSVRGFAAVPVALIAGALAWML